MPILVASSQGGNRIVRKNGYFQATVLFSGVGIIKNDGLF